MNILLYVILGITFVAGIGHMLVIFVGSFFGSPLEDEEEERFQRRAQAAFMVSIPGLVGSFLGFGWTFTILGFLYACYFIGICWYKDRKAKIKSIELVRRIGV